MGQILVADELDEGMFITVHSEVVNTENNNPLANLPPLFPEFPRQKVKGKYSFYKGKVLKIIAIDFPYIAAEFYGNSKGFISDKINEVVLDIREVNLMELTTNFVQKVEPNFQVIPYKKEKVNWEFEQEKE